ncbi:MAG: hypothetical protein EOP88_05505 [Verrucomicrobiaceae bacterium]|nr:MAG: hypothetical protein EOP88_05505 [Verrucomicrobiaceae bacterium]
MQQGYIECGGYDDEIEVRELVIFWAMVETVAKASEKSDLVDRVLEEIEKKQLYVSYESVVVLDDVVGQDAEGFLSILDNVLHMIRNAPDHPGEAFYDALSRPGLLDFQLRYYLSVLSKKDLLWVVYRVYAMVATVNQRPDRFLGCMGIIRCRTGEPTQFGMNS